MKIAEMKLPETRLRDMKIPDVKLPETKIDLSAVDLPKVDPEAIAQAIADRLPRRRSGPPVGPLLLLGVLWGAALAWFAFARAAAPLRAGLATWVEDTKQRLPAAVDGVRDWAGASVYRTADRIEHTGDAIEDSGQAFYRPGDIIDPVGDDSGDEMERVGEGIETPPIG
jgi:hypothetical protein